VLFLALRGHADLATAPVGLAVRWLIAPATRPVPFAALLRLLVLLGAATVALALAFDSRYRGFPLATYALPAVAFILLQIRAGRWWQPIIDGREERALSVIFVGCALYIAWNEGPLNWQSLSWCGLLLLYTLNIAGAWRARQAPSLNVVPAA
jgi:hypothetical protein